MNPSGPESKDASEIDRGAGGGGHGRSFSIAGRPVCAGLRGACWAALLLLVTVTGAPAQQEQGTGRTERRAVVAVSALGETSEEVIPRILLSQLVDTLESSGISVSETVRDEALAGAGVRLPREERISAVLGELAPQEADVVVGAFYLRDGEELFVQFVLYDPLVDTVLGGVLTRSRAGLTVFEGVESALESFDPVLERYLEGGYYADEPEGLAESIRVTGATEGARVFFIDRSVGRISAGELPVPFVQYELGTDLRVTGRKDGYHTVETVKTLEEPNTRVSLPTMQRKTRFDLGLRWSFGLAGGFGLSARAHLVPDRLFAGVEHYRLFAPAPSGNARDVTYYDYNLRLGRYFLFDHSSLFRFHLSVGAGLLVSDVDGLSGREYTDWYAVIGDPTVELNLGRIDVFGRLDLHYALGLGYNTLGRVWMRTPFGLPPITLGGRYSW